MVHMNAIYPSSPASSSDTRPTLDVELQQVVKFFNGEVAVADINLQIPRGEFFSILGPSGCGKTTTLRLIAGFEQPSSGEVLIRGEAMSQVPPYRRPVNTVFQSYALFGHMNVWDNVAFGLKIKHCRPGEIKERVHHALRLVRMDSFSQRYPNQLSGGQQQRVALARALVNRPAVLLLDEPLGALDLKLRKEMQVELSNLHQELGLTFVMVTHDQEEALSLSDRIAVMNHARIEQVGTPSEIYDYPATPFVAEFIGDTNLFPGQLLEWNGEQGLVKTASGLQMTVASSPGQDRSLHVNQAVTLTVRPEKLHLDITPPERANCFLGTLRHVMYLGTHVQCIVELPNGDRLMVRQAKLLNNPETSVYVSWSPQDSLLLTTPPES